MAGMPSGELPGRATAATSHLWHPAARVDVVAKAATARLLPEHLTAA